MKQLGKGVSATSGSGQGIEIFRWGNRLGPGETIGSKIPQQLRVVFPGEAGGKPGGFDKEKGGGGEGLLGNGTGKKREYLI